MDDETLGHFRENLKGFFPSVNGHPDVAGLFRSPAMLNQLGSALAAGYQDAGITKVVAPEARGPVLGALVAKELGAGLVLVRKDGRNHPGADIRTESEATWTGERQLFQGRSFDLDDSDVVLVVDDWITTGNTARAVIATITDSGAHCAGVSVIVNKSVGDVISELSVRWLVLFDEIVKNT